MYLNDIISNGSNRILDIGSGTGYMAALLCKANKNNFVYALEHVP